ncbi:hypothetical protein B0H10DRAFT_2432638 [Mycena sp. CBHHK59/15]|nr:hypothetical protein B0H10DRAFT_2432638 [Mycena sp. CBHHK59/15]
MAEDNIHQFFMEAHRISQEAQFIVDSLPNAEQPAVERLTHQLSAIRTILATLDDPAIDAAMLSDLVGYVDSLLQPLENFLSHPPPPAWAHIPLNPTGGRGCPSYNLDLDRVLLLLHDLGNTWGDIAKAMGVTNGNGDPPQSSAGYWLSDYDDEDFFEDEEDGTVSDTTSVPTMEDLLAVANGLADTDDTGSEYTPSDLVLTKPRSWYSDDIPVTDVGCLLSRPIPPKDFLLRLEEEAGQAWFDGCPPADHGPDLVAMLENLTVQNTALKAQLAVATSEPVSAVTASSTSVRGQFASRGKSRKKSGSIANRNLQASVPTAPRESDESDVDSDTPSQGTPAVYLGTKDCTTPELKAARRAIQTFVSKILRDVCGVGSKDLWPDPTERRVNEITEEVYLTPVFASDVTDPRNQHIFTIVTERAYTDLQRRSNWPTAARKVNGRWDRDLLHDMAKIAFRNLKPGWKAQVDAEEKTRNNLKKRNDRRTQRRVNKAIQRRSAVSVYAEDENLDPAVVTELVFEEHMSDEVSEPDSDDDTYESTAVWKAEMAKSAGFINLSQAALDKLEILEVVTPDWRADKMSKMFHRLHQIYLDSQSKRDKNKIVFVRVRNTGRRCRRIPAVAPYNFGIAHGWLEQARCDPENVPLLVGWGTFENPAGFEEVEVTGEDVHGGDPVENSNADGTNSTTGLADRDLNELLFLSDPHVAAAS